MTIASDFYDYLLLLDAYLPEGRSCGLVDPGAVGHKLHSRIVEMEGQHATLKAERDALRKLALDGAAGREVARRKRDGEPAVSYDDIRAAYERRYGTIGA